MQSRVNNWLLLILIIFIVTFSCLYNYQLKKKIVLAKEKMELLGLERDLLLDNSMLQYSYNEASMKNIKIYSDTDEELMLTDLLEDDYKIVFKFSYLHCLSCVSSILNELDNMSKEIPKEKILILGEYENKRAFEAFKEGHKISLPIYYVNTNNDVGNNVLKKENMPYVCLLNKDLRIRHLLIPMKEIPIHIERYLKIMLKRYMNDSGLSI